MQEKCIMMRNVLGIAVFSAIVATTIAAVWIFRLATDPSVLDGVPPVTAGSEIYDLNIDGPAAPYKIILAQYDLDTEVLRARLIVTGDDISRTSSFSVTAFLSGSRSADDREIKVSGLSRVSQYSAGQLELDFEGHTERSVDIDQTSNLYASFAVNAGDASSDERMPNGIGTMSPVVLVHGNRSENRTKTALLSIE